MLDEILSVKFEAPRQNGAVALESCVSRRRSVRAFKDQALAPSDLGQLLWAAQGLTGDEAKRAAPSAGALYPLALQVAVKKVSGLAPGVYRYRPRRHELLLGRAGERHERIVLAASGQDWIATAPAIICIAAVFERTTEKYGNRGRRYVEMEAGHAAQNLMLQAVALGLATTMVGAFSDEEVKRIFDLDPDETPLCIIPVGVAEIG
jgi:SagB-type dehydrogenase family enzyme